MQLMIEGLAQPLDYDIRAQFEKPLFRQGITSIDDISPGTKLRGKSFSLLPLNLSRMLTFLSLWLPYDMKIITCH